MSDERYTPAEVNPDGANQTNPYGPGGMPPPPPPPPPTAGGGGTEYVAPPPSASGVPQTGANLLSRQQFINLELSEVKKMVEGADPGHVKTVGENWKELHDDLVGPDGGGGLKKKFDDAVKKVLETWHGKSAEKFAKQAQKISQDFADVSYRPAAVGNLLEQVADRLTEVMGFVSSVKEPSEWERKKDRVGDYLGTTEGKISLLSPGVAVANLAFSDTGRDDSGLNADLNNPSISIAQAVNNHAGTLSIDRERQLEAAHYVEQLASVYRSAKDEIERVEQGYKGPQPPIDRGGGGGGGGGGGMPNISPFDTGKGVGAGPGTDMPTADIPGYESTTPVPSPASTDLNGISGPKPGSQVGTGLDGIGTGTGGVGTGGGGIGGLSGGGLGTGGGAGSGTGNVGAVGMPGGMPGAGGGAAGRGSGRMGGMPGAGGAGAAGGAGKGGAGRGALARKAGGAVGTPGRGGMAAQGGAGLHKSRGGSQAGRATGRGMGMMGAPGARGAGGNDKNRSERPDYLVEDEDSWTPQRNVAPRVIE